MEPDTTEQLNEKYAYVKTIGYGSSAQVALVREIKTEQLYACKIVSRERLKDVGTMKMFEQELRLMQTLDHPNIVKIHEIIFGVAHIYIIMEYCERGELYTLIVDYRRFDENDVRRFSKQILSALSYLHQRKIAHRDIKPENILLDHDLNIKIADFGVCRQTSDDDNLVSTRCGTLYYVSPEIIKGIPYDGTKADIWSLGIVLYIMSVGSLPWTSSCQKKLTREIEEKEIVYPDSMSPKLKDFISQMLNRDPAQRASTSSLLLHPFVHNKHAPIHCAPSNPVGFPMSCSSPKIFYSSSAAKLKMRPIIRMQNGSSNAVNPTQFRKRASLIIPNSRPSGMLSPSV